MTFELRLKGQSVLFIFQGQEGKGVPGRDCIKGDECCLEVPVVLFGGASMMRG